MKMYILIRESVPVGKAVVASAHASLACYLKYQDHPNIAAWLAGPAFYKAVCKVTDAEFELAKQEPNHVVLTESTLDNQEVAIAFVPREEYPRRFQFFRLYK
jgi:peptidyl-tRNA hydrolase